MLKGILEAALSAEMEAHLDDEQRSSGNRKNGFDSKQLNISAATLAAITDKIIPLVAECPLEPLYCIVWLDAMYYTKSKGTFTGDMALLKLIYQATQNIQKNGRCRWLIGVLPSPNSASFLATGSL